MISKTFKITPLCHTELKSEQEQQENTRVRVSQREDIQFSALGDSVIKKLNDLQAFSPFHRLSFHVVNYFFRGAEVFRVV